MASIEKGTFYLFGSRFVFFITGYVLLFVLGRFLLTPAEFGIFGVVLSIVSLVNIVLITGIQQAVSKFVSETPAKSKAILRQALKIQFFFSLLAFCILFFSADFLAMLLNDSSIGFYLKIAAFIPLFQPFFSAMVGYLNGLKAFKRQAIFTSFYRIMRAGFPIALVLIGLSLFGVFAGLALASLSALILGAVFIGTGKPGFYSKKKILLFSLPIVFYVLLQNSFFSIDLLFLKALVTGPNSSLFAGYYTAAQTIARLPLELAVTLSLVLFPLVSETVYAKNLEKSRFYIKSAYRYAFIAVAPFAVMIATTANPLISLIFGNEYALGAVPLAVLSIGFVFMTLFIISETIITAKGNPFKAALLAFAALIVDIALLLALVPALGLLGAAYSSLIAMFFAAIISISYVFSHFKIFPFKSIARTLLASCVVAVASFLVPVSGLLLIGKYIALLAIFLASMLLVGELKKSDLERAARMVF